MSLKLCQYRKALKRDNGDCCGSVVMGQVLFDYTFSGYIPQKMSREHPTQHNIFITHFVTIATFQHIR